MLTLIIVSFLLSARLGLSASIPKDYCNAPHVNASHYQPAEEGAQLVHLTVIMRHHKRTPIALVPDELAINDGIEWDCSGVEQFTYDGGGARLSNSVVTPPDHPFAQQMWAGTCESGQLTTGGFHDSMVHGKDLWELYHGRFGFLRSVDPDEIGAWTIQSADARGLLMRNLNWQIDSLAPSYKCPRADALVAAAQAAPFWKDTLKDNLALKERIDSVLGTTNSKAVWPNTFTFYQDVFTSRVCNDHPLPCNATGYCVSEEDAAKIFELGNLEYDYLWHWAENATEYNQLTFGVMFSELAKALKKPKHPLALYVAHDSSLVRIAAGLRVFPLRWPRLGSEFVIEIWRDKNGTQFVRVLYDGELIDSLRWTPLATFIDLLREQVPDHLFEKCASVAGKSENVKGPSFVVQ